jgi:hypothetical protein
MILLKPLSCGQPQSMEALHSPLLPLSEAMSTGFPEKKDGSEVIAQPPSLEICPSLIPLSQGIPLPTLDVYICVGVGV